MKRSVCPAIPWLFSCLLGASLSTAQVTPMRPAVLTTAQGLPHRSVTGMVQDKTGFIWIATADGLARYDGRTMKIFRNRPDSARTEKAVSLVDNKITQLEPTGTGQLLIGTESGNFQLFDPVTERFTMLLGEPFLAAHKAVVNQVRLSADGRHVWGVMPGVRLIDYDRMRKTVRVYDALSLMGEVNMMPDFLLTATGYLYTTCSKGVFQLNTHTLRKRIIPYPFELLHSGFASVDHHDIVEGPNGQLVVFGYQLLAIYDPEQDRFRTVPIPDLIRASQIYYAMKTLSDNQLYLGYMNRLYRLDASDRLTRLATLPGGSAADTKLKTLLRDRSGVLWLSTESAGLQRVDLNVLPFDFRPLRKSFAEDLIEQDLNARLPAAFESWQTPWWPRYTTVGDRSSYLIDPYRVYQHDPARHQITELSAFQHPEAGLCCKICLKGTLTGQLWLYGNCRGLVQIGLNGSTDRLYANSQLPIKKANPAHDAGDIQPMGRSVWVGSQYGLGLFRYDLDRKRYDPPFVNQPNNPNSLADNTINCLTVDPIDSTVLWIGTAGGGLCRLATATAVRPHDTFRRLGEAEGFPNGTIQSIATDSRGFLWCATNRGLVRLNAQTLHWRHFTTDDGLAENEFLRTSSAVLPDGRLVFGAPSGRVVFDPLAIRDDAYEPPIVLTALKINNETVDANQPERRTAERRTADHRTAGFSLTAPINALSELVLDHTQNFLTFAFAGLHYGKSEKVTYRYRLTGVDPAWVNAGTQNTANYTQLSPGRYTFMVNASTADGRWSRHTKQLAVVINPPLWATWWAYGGYLLVIGGLIFAFVRFRVGQVRQRQEMALKQREAEQLRAIDAVKTRFFSNITHEFRTPLSLILSPTEKLLQEPKHDPPTRQVLTLVHRNAGQLLRLINQLLDLSKLEGGNMAVSFSRGNGVLFISQLVESFRAAADTRQIDLHLHNNGLTGDPNGDTVLFDADKWEKILTNLLSNALKFTPAGGQVSVAIQQPAPDQLVVEVADTGIGISAETLPHIFDRFYQVDDSRTRAYEGTGIGLSLVKELTEVLGGSIAVESRNQPPAGTVFTLMLPLLPPSEHADAPAAMPVLSAMPLPAVLPDQPVKPVWTDEVPLILVADDNAELRTFMADELAGRYRVLTAVDGEEGWQLVQAELPDVVVSDVMMPRMDGYQLTHCIKSTVATNHIAVLLLTAKAAHHSRITGLEQGADDYLTKPFHLDELHLRLANLFERRQRLRTLYHEQFTRSDTDFRPQTIESPFLQHLYSLLEDHLDDACFGVDELAREAGMSRRTLHRKLSALVNLTAHDLMRQYRLKRAAQFLLDGYNVSETAMHVGYESAAHFTLIFKGFYKKTPTEFSQR